MTTHGPTSPIGLATVLASTDVSAVLPTYNSGVACSHSQFGITIKEPSGRR
jgi:creatinine amidohydrolase/Fe(II)-dependent formamide hydrolase-like protein